jgi:uncharacterized membrane protein YeaQ/YmgE (transglycosylase-associated protein family)
MSIELILIWVLIGAISGLTAKWLIGGVRSGVLGAIVIGILGAFIGGWLFGVFGLNVAAGFIGQVSMAVAGAVILLFGLRHLRRL